MTSPAFTALEIQNSNSNDDQVRAPIIERGRTPWRQFICDVFQVAGYTCVGTAFFAFIFLPHYLWYRYVSDIGCDCGD